MKRLIAVPASIALVCGLAGSAFAAGEAVTGAGSTFIYPALAKWAAAYKDKTGHKINYQAIGSGGGLRQLAKGTVDFAASDKPLTATELKEKGYMQFPAIVGGIVMSYNLPSVKKTLVLNGQTVADIYQGKIKYWDNAAVQKLNPGVSLPHKYITTVHRADGSGTTFNFTYYLSKVSKSWNKEVSYNTVVAWPGVGVGGKGNAGVANYIKQIPGAIGYVEYAYAKETHMPAAKMVNASGHVVEADMETFKAAAKNAKWQAKNGFHLILANAPGEKSWPIAASTFVLVHKDESAKKVDEVLKFFHWSYHHGQKMAEKLDYVPIPKPVYQLIGQEWAFANYKVA
ncbi:phosphate ABC transporter substrate-binding protein PstS [Piscirickettsia litoralis]|uniref:Phosphate-binding protein PstS n=1 Tax=Piscirickettsia litoralis TaxID=1891921 RepID=A0ABX3A779_9GAMM|nr:phosphate ABC transporter substrate-binding protein PstS [Piscirickettsia litoralis]ODN43551.1 phosphate ABC transporter substrate-binding protein PstS [Piscirickettsia litoralis]